MTLASAESGRFEVRGLSAGAIGDIAAHHGLRLHELAPVAASLESAYMKLTRGSVEYTGTLEHQDQPFDNTTDTSKRAA